MTPSNGDRLLHNHRKTRESYELVTRHQDNDSDLYELDEDINPDSDASLLWRHFASSNKSHDSLPDTEIPAGLFQRFISLMSRTPLLLRSSPAQGTGSYGALPVHDLSFSTDASEVDEGEVDDLRRRDRRKGKGSALRQVVTNNSLRSRHGVRASNGSTATQAARRRQSKSGVNPTLPGAHMVPTEIGGTPYEDTSPGTNSGESVSGKSEEDVGSDTDSNDDGWSVEDPPDNSPLVKSLPGYLCKSDCRHQYRCFIQFQLCLYSVPSCQFLETEATQNP